MEADRVMENNEVKICRIFEKLYQNVPMLRKAVYLHWEQKKNILLDPLRST